MTTDEFVSLTILKATGELSQAVYGDDDYSKVLQLANNKLDAWAKEDEWNSLYDPGVDCGTVTASDSIDLDDNIREVRRDGDD